jgi:hypothetical protein
LDKKIVGLVGAITALAVPQALQAKTTAAPTASEVLRVQSYGELLDPIPNAAALLRVADAAPPSSQPAGVQVAQYHHHHHHHHHHWWRRYHHHHHAAYFGKSRVS